MKSVATVCLALRREALRLRGTLTGGELLVRVHPEVARALQKEERAIVEELERALAGGVSIGRLVTAEEVAAVVAFLASPRSVALNGDAVAAGGGARGSIHY